MIALIEAGRAGLYAPRELLKSVVAGIVVGVVALPLAMAFAIASGARPEHGIYTAIIAGAVVSVFGGSRVQVAGPTGAFIAILASVTATHGIDGLQIATFMAGLILAVMGFARMGAVLRFIPAPVIVGFTAGIGVIIFVGQWRDFFGLPKTGGEHFHERLGLLIQAFPALDLPTTGIAAASLALVVVSPRLPGLRRVPGPLVAMVAATLLQATMHFPSVATIGTAFGGIPQGLPSLSLPEITLAKAIALIGPAFTIAMLGAIESLLSAVVADGMAGTRHDSNQELVGQGIANVLTPLFGGFAATGAIARTATNVRNGGNSPIAGITHALFLVGVLVALAPLASSIPLAALAAILFVVAYNMSEPKSFARMLRRAPAADRAILIITFVLTVFADLVVAVNVGVILAVLQFLRRMAESVDVQRLGDKALASELRDLGLAELPPDLLVYEIDGPFFFAAVESFERALVHSHGEPKALVLRMRRVPFIDISGLEALEEVVEDLQSRGVRVLICEANERVGAKLAKAGVVDLVGPDNFVPEFAAAMGRAISDLHPSAAMRAAASQLLRVSSAHLTGERGAR